MEHHTILKIRRRQRKNLYLMEAFVGRIRRKKVPNSESYVSEGKKNVNLSKVSNSLFRKISYIYCMQTKFSTRQKKITHYYC